MTRFFVADDYDLMRARLIELLTADPQIEIGGRASTGREAVSQTRRLAPDVVLTDVRMANLDGIAATDELTRASPGHDGADSPPTAPGQRRCVWCVRAGTSHRNPPSWIEWQLNGRLLAGAGVHRPAIVHGPSGASASSALLAQRDPVTVGVDRRNANAEGVVHGLGLLEGHPEVAEDLDVALEVG